VRFLCVLLLVGLVATPRSEPDGQSQVGAGETRQTLSGASQNVRADGSGEHKTGAAGTLGTDWETAINRTHSYGLASPVTESDAPSRPVRGYATWYDAPSPQDAAAGPSLRKALGRHWRGSTVRVTSGGRSVTVRLTDWCACGPRHRTPTVLDLDDVAFERLAPQSWDPVDDGPFLSQGVVRVRVSVLGQIDVPLTRPAPTGPPTDVQ
jgi:hypothetical protein